MRTTNVDGISKEPACDLVNIKKNYEMKMTQAYNTGPPGLTPANPGKWGISRQMQSA